MRTNKHLRRRAGEFFLSFTLIGFAPLAHGQALEVLHSFQGSEGSNPWAELMQGSNGNFYGTTYQGGANGVGTIFQITTNGALTTLVSFNSSNGRFPVGGLVQGSDGDFYGTTKQGGDLSLNNGFGYGTVFKMTPVGALTTLVRFNNSNGASPQAKLLQGSDGQFYGQAYGVNVNAFGGTNFGSIFKVTTNGVLTTLHWFSGGNDGRHPETSGLMLGSDGNFYGLTTGGGANGRGTVFKMTPAGILTTLVSFNVGDGRRPSGILVERSDGNLYGTTSEGGAFGGGTVFKMTPDGVLTTLISFDIPPNQYGPGPWAGLLLASDGNFYGTTHGGNDKGTVFQMTPGGGLTTLVRFNGTNGNWPEAALVQGSDGNLYGTTYSGGANGRGTVYRIVKQRPLAPVILTQPQDQTVTVGQNATFTVVAGGTPPLAYQWQFKNSPITGATGTSLSLTNVQTGDSGPYSVTITNSAGVTVSSNANLAVIQPLAPVILTQPQDQTVPAGQNATFTVVAVGSPPLAYQWQFNNSPITGATGISLSLTNVQTGDGGPYSVTITNIAGISVSSNANLAVIQPLAITNLVVMPRPSSAIIQWASVPATISQIEYGIAPGYGNISSLEGAEQTDHAVLLTGLILNTNYVFRIHSHVGINETVSGPYAFFTDLTIIVDNPQAQYSGNWTLGMSSPDKYGAYYQYAPTTAGFSPSALAIYTPAIVTPGKYDVAIWYPQGTNRTTNAQVSLYFNGGSITKSVNQTTGGGTWQLLLPAADFATGPQSFATIGNDTRETNRVVMADALRWSYTTSQDLPMDGTVPDWWSGFYFGGAVDATLDPDGDGYSTFAEYVLGTDPTSANSHLTTRATRTPEGLLFVFAPWQGGRTYELQSSTNLAGRDWLASPATCVSSNGQGIFSLTNSGQAGPRFYRLSVRLTRD